MKALYEVIAKTIDGQGGVSVHTEILEFLLVEHFDQFKYNMTEYESVDGLQVWRSITRIN